VLLVHRVSWKTYQSSSVNSWLSNSAHLPSNTADTEEVSITRRTDAFNAARNTNCTPLIAGCTTSASPFLGASVGTGDATCWMYVTPWTASSHPASLSSVAATNSILWPVGPVKRVNSANFLGSAVLRTVPRTLQACYLHLPDQ
jgi:hypothetical protein